MAHAAETALDARGHRFCLVASRFNQAYVDRLVQGALEVLRNRGAAEDDLEVMWVPGAFELPLACQWAASSSRYSAVIAFGVVIRGETEHFRLVAEASARGLCEVSLKTDTPVLNGVLAAATVQQVADRTGGALGNRGAEVALAAVQMAGLRRRLGRG
jgi:6,7-dimethyl-8-ribityllumazine synthase